MSNSGMKDIWDYSSTRCQCGHKAQFLTHSDRYLCWDCAQAWRQGWNDSVSDTLRRTVRG